MLDKKNKNNVCYCETCRHKTAGECLELQCSCCVRADQIRLGHLVVPESDLSFEERSRREMENREQEMKDEQDVIFGA